MVGPERPHGEPEKDEAKHAVNDPLPAHLGNPGREVLGEETCGVMRQDERVFDHGRSG